jgi:L-seryl-tRNA(Ser) seleniumtransferase
VRAILSAKRTLAEPPHPAAPAGDVTGQWQVEITFAATKATHVLQLRQQDARVEGTHQGDFLTRDLSGTLAGSRVTLTSRVTERTGDALNYRFTGELSGDMLSGTLDLGEYRSATWIAKRVTPA